MNIKNPLGKTALLKDLSVGESVTWNYDPNVTTADKQMKLFTATLTRLEGMKIKQVSGLVVVPGLIPYGVVVIERIA